MSKVLRCAIYTRKSSEEGLEQGFNSLHAQREACEAYVLSQAGEGWSALPMAYDDGGFSGGSMERPGLQALLADINRDLIDIVVVYKVDRLTRALSDFARMVELFDARGVSFVSVTQAFNTTTSMGRLTLNVLLSFAQFEREVTGERIRDKIAASKAKGLWMGGRPPLGYDGVDRKLVINAGEADVVRQIFSRYLELGSVTALEPDLRARGVVSKRWINKQGQLVGGGEFSRGALYHLLSNPVYRGAIRHRDRLYPDAHAPIVDEATWSAVQAKLAANCPDHPQSPRTEADVLLRDLVFDDRGNAMRAIHTKRGDRRYRYYAVDLRDKRRTAGSLPRLAMGVLDSFVVDRVSPLLARGWEPDAAIEDRTRTALLRVTVGEDRIVMTLRPEAVISELAARSDGDDGCEVAVAIRLKRRQGAVLIEAPQGASLSKARIDRALVRAVCLARRWADQLAGGEAASTRDLAIRHGLCNHYAAKLLPLAWLAPDLTAAILEGRQPPAITLAGLTRQPLPMDWDEQRRLFDAVG